MSTYILFMEIGLGQLAYIFVKSIELSSELVHFESVRWLLFESSVVLSQLAVFRGT